MKLGNVVKELAKRGKDKWKVLSKTEKAVVVLVGLAILSTGTIAPKENTQVSSDVYISEQEAREVEASERAINKSRDKVEKIKKEVEEKRAEEANSKELTKVEAKKKLKETYGIGTIYATKDDTTGNWGNGITFELINEESSLKEIDQLLRIAYKEYPVIHIISGYGATTTMFSRMTSDHTYIDITEWNRGEEHSAKTIGTGKHMTHFNLINGELEKITE